MKRTNIIQSLFAILFMLGFVACSEKEESIPTPIVRFENATYTIAENATSALKVNVTSSATLSYDITVNFTVEGTAVEGTNYQTVDPKTVTIKAGETEGVIFINPIDVATIEENKTIILSLVPGTGFSVGEATTITITDNETPAIDAPTISFTSAQMTTNAYLEEVKEITIGLTEVLSKDIAIPLAISGSAQNNSEFVLTGVNANNEIVIPAGQLSAKVTLEVIYTAVTNIDVDAVLTLQQPATTDAVIDATKNTFALSIVDPVVDMSTWFNSDTQYNYFHKSSDNNLEYLTGEHIYGYTASFVREYYNSVDQEYKTLSSSHYWTWSDTDRNQWIARTNQFKKLVGWSGVDIEEQVRWENEGGDFLGLFKFFGNEAKYGRANVDSEKGWLRFAATEENATSGSVVIPAQTLTLYKENDEAWWDEKTTKTRTNEDGEEETETIYSWYGESNVTKGIIAKSTHVDNVEIIVERSVGTFNKETSMINIDITFTCDDEDFTLGSTSNEKYLIARDGDTYTMRLQYRLK